LGGENLEKGFTGTFAFYLIYGLILNVKAFNISKKLWTNLSTIKCIINGYSPVSILIEANSILKDIYTKFFGIMNFTSFSFSRTLSSVNNILIFRWGFSNG